MKKLKLHTCLFIIGIMLMISPIMMEAYKDWKQDRLLQEAEQWMSGSPVIELDPPLETEYAQLLQVLEQSAMLLEEDGQDERETIPETQPDEVSDSTSSPASASRSAIAILEIDKIDVKLPVLEGATRANMEHAAAHMKETTPIGEIGNAAIAAHRARKKGRLFNRLDELQAGDQIVVRTGGRELVYTVFQVSLVEPADISVLGKNDKDAVLTLITCDPVINPTHRLIVHAKL